MFGHKNIKSACDYSIPRLKIPCSATSNQSCPCRWHLLIHRKNVRDRSDRSDGEGVDLLMTPSVMVFDVRELGRASKGVVIPVKVTHPPEDNCQYRMFWHNFRDHVLVEVWVAATDIANVALEVLDVNCVEANYGRV